MIFIEFWQFLGDHVPALGAVCVQLLVVAGWSFLVSKWATHKANKRWQWDVEKNSDMLKHDIREKFEHRQIELEARNKYLEERNDQLGPSLKALTEAVAVLAQEKKG